MQKAPSSTWSFGFIIGVFFWLFNAFFVIIMILNSDFGNQMADNNPQLMWISIFGFLTGWFVYPKLGAWIGRLFK